MGRICETLKTAVIFVIFIGLIGCDAHGVPDCSDYVPQTPGGKTDEGAPADTAPTDVCLCRFDQIDAGAGCEGCQEASICMLAKTDAGVSVPQCVPVWQ